MEELSYNKIIYDENQVIEFFNIISRTGLKDDEVYFLSASARNKYLTTEEREEYDLGRTEMFDRKVFTAEEAWKFLGQLKKFETVKGGLYGRSGKPIPTHCLVIYANINPLSGLRAFRAFQSQMHDITFETFTNKESLKHFAKLHTHVMNAYQTSRGSIYLRDIDFDLPPEGKYLVREFCDDLNEQGVAHWVIQTRSGYHVLMNKADIAFNYPKLIGGYHEVAQSKFGVEHVEIKENKNQMVPVPGCMQAGFPVKILTAEELRA
jgi:hypothetical protein